MLLWWLQGFLRGQAKDEMTHDAIQDDVEACVKQNIHISLWLNVASRKYHALNDKSGQKDGQKIDHGNQGDQLFRRGEGGICDWCCRLNADSQSQQEDDDSQKDPRNACGIHINGADDNNQQTNGCVNVTVVESPHRITQVQDGKQGHQEVVDDRKASGDEKYDDGNGAHASIFTVLYHRTSQDDGCDAI